MKTLVCLSLRRFALPFLVIAAMLTATTGFARASEVTLDVYALLAGGELFPGPGFCGQSCTLFGSFTFDNSTGDVVSADITASGFPENLGPFTTVSSQGISGLSSANTYAEFLGLDDSLYLHVVTPTSGSFAGYIGGPLIGAFLIDDQGVAYSLEAGFTLVSSTPLPSTWTMMLIGVMVLGFITNWRTKKNTAALSAA